MSPVPALSSSKQPNVFDPRIDLGSVKPLPSKGSTRPNAGLKAGQGRGVTPGSGSNSVTAGPPPPGTKIYKAPDKSPEMPSAYMVPRPPFPQIRTGVDKIPFDRQEQLKGAGWVPLIDNKLEISFSPVRSAENGGKQIYAVRGAKSTVLIESSSFAEAAKMGVRFMAAGMLAPRTQNIAVSKPLSSENKQPNFAIKQRSKPPAPKVTKQFVPTKNEPIPKDERIDWTDRKFTPR